MAEASSSNPSPVTLIRATYGSSPEQSLLIHRPLGQNAPIVFAMAGHALTSANSNEPFERAANNLLARLAARGLVGVLSGYRSGPLAVYPSGVMDISSALGWIEQNASAINADMTRLYLLGIGAATMHVAGYAYDDRAQIGLPPVRGVVLIDCVRPDSSDVEVYFGDHTLAAALAPWNFVQRSAPPTFIARIATTAGNSETWLGLHADRLQSITGRDVRNVDVSSKCFDLLDRGTDSGEELIGHIMELVSANNSSGLPARPNTSL